MAVQTGSIPDTANARKTERMPWKVSSVMEEKLRFVFGYARDEQTRLFIVNQ